MKILFLIISTNKHNRYIPTLVKSIKKYTIPQSTDILLFSDDSNTDVDICKPIIHLPWPLTTLLRFNYFNTVTDIISSYDYVFYMDSDMEVVDYLQDVILPANDEIVTTSHYHYSKEEVGPYEFNNKDSTAYVEYTSELKGKYCQGCFFGGASKIFLNMAAEIDNNIKTDLNKNIIARWHDESHFNKFILNKKTKQLDQRYCFNPNHSKGYTFSGKILHFENKTFTY